MISFMLFARAFGRNVITSLDHTGVAMSYTQTLDLLRKAALDVSRSVNFREGRWMLVFEYVNFQKNFVMREWIAIPNLGTSPVEWQ